MTKTVLIIEDNDSIRELLKLRVEAEGFEAVVAADGVNGLNTAKEIRPDLIILDVELPELNGFTICSLLKANEEYRDIPIMMLTARKGKADMTFDEDYQPDAYLTKPFDAKELVLKIRELVSVQT